MNQELPDIKPAGNRKFTKFLANTFVCDMLFPVYGESSVDTLFQGWRGDLLYNWSRFTNQNGDILEFYAEGQYVIKIKHKSKDVYQLKTPTTIKEFINDMKKFGVQLYWSDWVVKEFNSID